MATVIGKTSVRIDELLAGVVVSVAIINGRLIISTRDGGVTDAGPISGGGGGTAASTTYAGSTNLSATNVEAALDELDAEKAAIGDSRFTDARTPTGAAGGDLAGTYPNPTIGTGKVTSTHILDGTIVDGDVAAANKDGSAATPSLRTLGGGVLQAMPGNAKLNDLVAPAANVSMGGFKITNVLAGTAGTDAVNKAQMDALLTSLINGAPGALDQLNELAAALGNDPNFSSTILTALAGKASVFGVTYGTALVANTWSANIAHGLNANNIDVTFMIVATNEPLEIKWKRIDANNIQIKSSFAFAASALNVLVTGK